MYLAAFDKRQHIQAARLEHYPDFPELAGPQLALKQVWQLPQSAHLGSIGAVLLLAVLYDLVPGVPIGVTFISAAAQQVAVLLVMPILTRVLRSRHRLPNSASLPIMAIALVSTHALIGHAVVTQLTHTGDQPVLRVLFWLIAAVTWNPAVLYLVIQARTRRRLLHRLAHRRQALDEQRHLLQQEREASRAQLAQHLTTVTRPHLRVIRHSLARSDDLNVVRQLAEELRSTERALRALLNATDVEMARTAGPQRPPAWKKVLASPVRLPLRVMLLAQLLLATIICALAARPTSTGLFAIAVLVIVVRFGVVLAVVGIDLACSHASRARNTSGRIVTPRVLLLVAVTAAGLPAVLTLGDSAKNALVCAICAICVGTYANIRVKLREARSVHSVSAARFTIWCVIAACLPAALLLLLGEGVDREASIFLALTYILLAVPAGYLANVTVNIAARNRRLHHTADRLLHTSEVVQQQRATVRSGLADLTHNGVQGRITSAAMGLDFTVDGLFTLDNVKARTLQQLDSATQGVDELIEQVAQASRQ